MWVEMWVEIKKSPERLINKGYLAGQERLYK